MKPKVDPAIVFGPLDNAFEKFNALTPEEIQMIVDAATLATDKPSATQSEPEIFGIGSIVTIEGVGSRNKQLSMQACISRIGERSISLRTSLGPITMYYRDNGFYDVNVAKIIDSDWAQILKMAEAMS